MKKETQEFIATLRQIYENFQTLSPENQEENLAAFKERIASIKDKQVVKILTDFYKLCDEHKKEKAK